MKINVLYRFYDIHGTLLYVGVSMTVAERVSSHKRESEWFKKSANVTFEAFPTRAAVLKAERNAIMNESPVYNVLGNKKNGENTKNRKKHKQYTPVGSSDPQDDPGYRMTMDNPLYVAYLASL